jgi:mannan endo-1,4-beta-mannosidase
MLKFAIIAVLLILVVGIGITRLRAQDTPAAPTAPLPAPSAAPVNPDATPEARELLKRIDAISGHYTLTGQHNFPNSQSRWSDRIYDLTGKLPAVFGSDFGFAGGDNQDSVFGRPGMIEEAKRQYRNGAVIALCWHEVRPTDDEPVTFRDSVQGKLSDFEWNELLTPGTDIYNRWVEQVDVVAGYLKQLQDAGVPVLFRPYHEMNGNWFWWGGRPGDKGSAALYRQLFDRFVHVHHLNNLIWVWNSDRPSPNAGGIADFYPGAKYADVVTIDIYGEYLQTYYDTMLSIAGDKPVALGEVGTMPTLDVLAKQPRWAYFMMWSGMESANSPEQLQAVFHAPNILNRGDAPFIPLGDSHAAPGNPSAPEPVTPRASSQAKALLDRLHAAASATGLASGGTQILSGQQNDAASPTAASELVAQTAGKQPVVYVVELDRAHAPAVLDAAVSQAKAGSIVSLKWLAQNPADEDTAGSKPDTANNSGLGAGSPNAPAPDGQKRLLSDFEWRELMTPGTHLNQRWAAQVDELATQLKRLDEKGVAVLFTPYPDANGKQYWWASRPGFHGSAALYRMLFDRLVNQDHVKNVIWGWQVVPGGFGPPVPGQQANGPASEYFPGLLYVDAVSIEVAHLNPQFRAGAMLSRLAGNKAFGFAITNGVPDVESLSREPDLAWFELAPIAGPADDATALALKTLYGDAKIVSRQAPGQQ